MSVNKVNSDGSLTMIAGRGTATDTLKEDFSTVETTSTSTRAYNQGDSFIMETGQLVKATTAIAIGDTIAIGTNVVATSVAELLADKVDKEAGKGLSTNDYDNTAKGIVDSVTTNLATKADKVTNATNGNLAGLNSSGNLTDSTWSADKTTQSATGNPISISGLKSNQLAVNPIITFEPIQAGSGTPSPSNVRAISGYDKVEALSCGKNLFDGTYSETGKFINSSGVETANASFNISQYISVKPNTAYYFSNLSQSSSAAICWYNKAKEYISGTTVNEGFTATSPANACYVRASILNTMTNICINEGNTAITYVPYDKATSISESLGQTVYWGRWKPRTGEFEVLGGSVDLGTLTWQNDQTTRPADGATIHAHFASFTDCKVIASSAVANMYCSIYAPSTVNKVDYGGGNEVMDAIMGGADNNRRIWIYDSRYNNTSAADFKTAMSGIMLIYELATPFTIQLTPHEISLLKDYAYVSTNGTSIALDYHNGELASLEDVSQIGNTLNNLGGFLNGVLDNKFNLGLGLPSGNINLSIIQANFKSSGIAMHYVAESDWEGWSAIIGVLNNATVRSFIIISRRRIIYSYTTNNGTSWTTQTLVTAT